MLEGGKQFSANHIGWLLYKAGLMGGHRGGKGNFILGASAILRAMKRKGIVGCYRRGHDQWAQLLWYLEKEPEPCPAK
jgi:hypothetical protein